MNELIQNIQLTVLIIAVISYLFIISTKKNDFSDSFMFTVLTILFGSITVWITTTIILIWG